MYNDINGVYLYKRFFFSVKHQRPDGVWIEESFRIDTSIDANIEIFIRNERYFVIHDEVDIYRG